MKTTTSFLHGLAIKPIAAPSLAAIAVLLANATPGHAQSSSWTLNGTGLWSDSANWLGNIVADGSGNTATLNGGGATIHVDSPRTIGNLTVGTAGNYLIDNNGSGSNVLTLAGAAPTISVLGSSTVTISAQIAGTAGLTKASLGGSSSVLVLAGANTYSGTTSLSGGNIGFLQINSNAALGSSTLFINSQNGGLRYGAAFNDLRDISFGSSGGRIDTNGSDVTISSVLSGSISAGVGNSFTKQGNGTLTLAGTNNLVGGGAVSVLGGFLQADSNARLGSTTGAFTLNGGGFRYGAAFNDLRSITLGNNDGTLDTNGFNVTYSQTITGIAGQDLTKAGAGTLSISSDQSYLGATRVTAGTLLINGNNSGATGAVSVSALATLGGEGTIGGAVSVAANGTLAPGTLSDSTSTLTLASANLIMSAVDSKITLDITGASAGLFDRVVGINAFSLNGDITINLTGSYTTASWDLFDFASKSGNFDSITLTGSYNGTLTLSGDVWSNADIGGQGWTFDQSTGVLTAVPEPTTAILLLGAVSALGLAKRRRLS